MAGQLLFSSASPLIAWSFLGAVPQNLAFARASSGSYAGASQLLQTAGANGIRLDCDPVSAAPRGLLIEGQRTNLVSPSVFAGSGWAITGGSLVMNAGTAPDGAATATRVMENTSNATHDLFSPTVPVTAGTSYTLSFYAQAGTATAIQFFTNGAVSSGFANFDLQNGALGTVGGLTASIAPAGNGWYRCSVTLVSGATQAASLFICFTNNSLTATRLPSYMGSGETFLLWGLQIEAGAYASSYVTTTSSAATRAADTLTAAPIPWFNASRGTLMIEAAIEGAGSNNLVSFDDGTSANVIGLAAATGQALVTAGGAAQFNGTCGAFTPSVRAKIALSFSPGGVSAVKDGGTVVKSAGGVTLPSGLATLRFGNNAAGSAPLDGWLRRFNYWNYAMSDADLQRTTL